MLQTTVKSLPKSPGVYQFFDKDGRLLYVGKAKNLNSRVKSYFKFTPIFCPATKLSLRIRSMIEQACKLEYIKVSCEQDALILENSLIKQLKPKYNILLRDDKTYPYIMVDFEEPFPRLEITRKVKGGKGVKYFGPYTSGAKELLDGVYGSFALAQKKSCVRGKKSCLFHQIGQCLAPCEGKISKEDYRLILDEAIEHISNPPLLLKILKKKMEKYSQDLKFEQAGLMRDMIKKIKDCVPQNTIDLAKMENFDLLSLFYEGSLASIVRLFIRNGKVVSSVNSLLRNKNGFELDEIYTQMLLSYYSKDMPININTIYLAHELNDVKSIENLLSEIFGKKIHIKVPKRGEKLALVKMSLENAKEASKKENREKYVKIKDEICSYFELEGYPENIEVFDNSHLSGVARVGAKVTWVKNSFEKKGYRHYHLEAKDEYAQMREMLLRRVESFDKESPPDLWVIDGGRVLLDLALDIVESSGVQIDVLAISKEKVDFRANRSKGRAKDIIHSAKNSFKLPTDDKKLQFLQFLRDEAHRFAISFHRKVKLKNDFESSELKKLGLSEAKIKKLLLYFGSFEAIKKADFEEIEPIIGIKEAKKLMKA